MTNFKSTFLNSAFENTDPTKILEAVLSEYRTAGEVSKVELVSSLTTALIKLHKNRRDLFVNQSAQNLAQTQFGIQIRGAFLDQNFPLEDGGDT